MNYQPERSSDFWCVKCQKTIWALPNFIPIPMADRGTIEQFRFRKKIKGVIILLRSFLSVLYKGILTNMFLIRVASLD